ncbi:MAG: O-antigen ligase family protein, partial [Geminicoccaceae bacterium]
IAFYWRDEFAALLARDTNFTHRTTVWRDALQLIAERPLTGYGYGAVWDLKDATWFPEVESTKLASDAQNGLLNLATQLGVPIALVALGQVLATLFRSVKAFALRPSGFCLFVIAYSVFFIVRNIAESDLYVARSDEWMLFVALSVAVVRYLQRDAAFDERHPRASEREPGWHSADAGR